MQIEYKSVKDVIPYENNARINNAAVSYVAKSIKEFGFKNPIIINKDNVIIAGHTRLLAAIDLGLDEVPTIQVTDLTSEQVRAYRIADNKTGEFAEWDFEKLEKEIQDIEMDMEQFGVRELELDYHSSLNLDDDLSDYEEPEKPIKELTCPKCEYTGEKGEFN